jgi:hypothetical protein
MNPRIIFASLALAATLATPAAATTATHLRVKHQVARRQEPQQIACTTAGCIAVPRQCGQEDGITPGGLPTGYDVIVCPSGVWPQF